MDRARHCPQGTSAVARVPRSARNGTRATVHKERLLWHTLVDPLAWIVRVTALKGHLLWHGYRAPLGMEHGPPFTRNVCCGTPLLIPSHGSCAPLPSRDICCGTGTALRSQWNTGHRSQGTSAVAHPC